MEVALEWQSSIIKGDKKKELENQIKQKISQNFETLVKRKVLSVKVTLNDADEKDTLAVGDISLLDEPELMKTCRIKIGHGIFIQCGLQSWYQPDASGRFEI